LGDHCGVIKQFINRDSSGASNEGLRSSPEGGRESPSKSGNSKMVSGKNILSSDVEIKGTLKFADELIIDGRIEGEITSGGHLTVGENARIQADINTRSVIVFGKVTGNITVADRCELKENAELHGDVTAVKLVIEEGAAFVGSSAVGTAAKNRANAVDGASSSSGSSGGNGKSKGDRS